MVLNSEEIPNDKNGEDLYRKIYVSHQLFDGKYNEVFSGIMEFAVYACTSVIILFSYITLRYKTESSLQFIVFSILFLSTLSLKMALDLGVTCHTASQKCIVLNQTNSASSSNRKYNKRFWKSCQPVSLRVGNQFELETKTYTLRVFGEYVPNNLVTLLLAF